ncbi:thiamine diphosphokinase [Meridianimarinicoccus sp. RP-17]|uniref:thiamine diphosphokinase n=1 Tax=Meridianimarinicoccus zhengii TaxID=2056810 RepID=UPI000DAF12BD|nr:thiamine diphosphokinase [Phycocomes zhengii]
MTAPVLSSDGPVVLVGGGPVRAADMADAGAHDRPVVAADGGADRALALGVTPRAVIGDMDSLSAAARAALGDAVHPVAEQDSTDFEKCLTRIAAPLVLAVGFGGGRLDHALAVFNALARLPMRRCVVLAAREVIVLAPPRIGLDLAPGTRVSLFPMAPVRGKSRGLHWPIDGIGFAPGGVIGTSNQAEGPVDLAFDAPGMLLMLPRRCLGAVLAGLEAAPGWPAG